MDSGRAGRNLLGTAPECGESWCSPVDWGAVAFAVGDIDGPATGAGILQSARSVASTPQSHMAVPVSPIATGGEVDGEWISGIATHYGESYNGSPLGCGTGDYHSDNPRIVAVGPAQYGVWPCGTRFEICGARGCILAERHDACPGCQPHHLDLSESGIYEACGIIATCEIRFRVIE